jgi:hypothetical protein
MADLPPHPASKADDVVGSDRDSPTRPPPRWVYVSGTIAVVLALLFLILHLAGTGLGGHTP